MTDATTTPMPRTVALLHEGIAQGLHLGAQLYVSREGATIIDTAVGHNAPPEPPEPPELSEAPEPGHAAPLLTPDHRMNWFSAGKPVTAVAIALLWQRGLLDLDDLVTRFIPEFAQHGKERITIRHLLTHTAGFRLVDTRWPDASWPDIVAAVCAARLEPRWIPGEKAGYHALSSFFVLGEIIRRIDGRTTDRFVREEIFEPLGMHDCWMCLTPEQVHEQRDRLGIMYDTAKPPAVTPDSWHVAPKATALSPGSSSAGPMRELARLYQMLLNRGSLDGVRLLTPQTVEALTTRQRVGMFDHTFKHPSEWSLAFLMQSDRDPALPPTPYGYGPRPSSRAFGHSGHMSSTVLADPKHQLIIAINCNGMPGNVAHDTRARALVTSVYDELGL